MAKSNFEKVQSFLEKYNQPLFIGWPSEKTAQERIDFIEEELNELKEAYAKKDIVKVADALGDLLYFVYGAGEIFGLPMDEVFDIIHNVNMNEKERAPTARSVFDVVKKSTYIGPELKIKELIDFKLEYYNNDFRNTN